METTSYPGHELRNDLTLIVICISAGYNLKIFCVHFPNSSIIRQKETLTPYCTCLSPLKKPLFIIGALLPMTILGVGSCVAAILTANPFILLVGITHILGGAGDILIVIMILREKLKGRNVMIFDHPYDIGFIVFEKTV